MKQPKFNSKKKYKVPIEAELNIEDIIGILREECLSHPEKAAKLLLWLGTDGDWTLETEYLKLLKKDIEADFGSHPANCLQQVIDYLGKSDGEDDELVIDY